MDADGRLIDCSTSQRVTSLPLTTLKRQAMVAVAGGRDKGPAILAALRGGWLTSLITDDQAARYIVERLSSQI